MTFQEEKPKLAKAFKQKRQNTTEFSAETFLNDYINKRKEEAKIEEVINAKRKQNKKEMETIKRIIE